MQLWMRPTVAAHDDDTVLRLRLMSCIVACMQLLFLVYNYTDCTNHARHYVPSPHKYDGRHWHYRYHDGKQDKAEYRCCTVLRTCMHLVVRPVIAHLSRVCGGRWEGRVGKPGREKGMVNDGFCKSYLAKSLFPFSMVYYLAPLFGNLVLILSQIFCAILKTMAFQLWFFLQISCFPDL